MCRPRLFNAGFVVCLVAMATGAFAGTFMPLSENGYAVGLMSDCEGVTKNATISDHVLPDLQVVIYKMGKRGEVVSKSVPITLAADGVSTDKSIDFTKKKTIVHFVGYFGHALLTPSRVLGETYVKHGYNVLYAHAFAVLSNMFPRTVRVSRVVGRIYGDFLADLTKRGLQAEDLHLVGVSLGAQVASFTAKQFYAVTGKKPARITGLDPSGPCFRSLREEDRLNPSDAERVDILHTNMDGMGMANRMGHVDFYANGGEYQPQISMYTACLTSCSHLKSFFYWLMSWQHQDQYIGVKCDSIQEARRRNCDNSTDNLNVMGPKTDFSRPGIYYLPVSGTFPFYMGKAGLKEDHVSDGIRDLNANDNLVIDRGISGYQALWNVLSFPQKGGMK